MVSAARCDRQIVRNAVKRAGCCNRRDTGEDIVNLRNVGKSIPFNAPVLPVGNRKPRRFKTAPDRPPLRPKRLELAEFERVQTLSLACRNPYFGLPRGLADGPKPRFD